MPMPAVSVPVLNSFTDSTVWSWRVTGTLSQASQSTPAPSPRSAGAGSVPAPVTVMEEASPTVSSVQPKYSLILPETVTSSPSAS